MMDTLEWLLPMTLALNVLALFDWLAPRGLRVVLRVWRMPAWRNPFARKAQPEPVPAEGMKAWIDEVERDESTVGDEEFWRRWAATGGNVPQAARTGRKAS